MRYEKPQFVNNENAASVIQGSSNPMTKDLNLIDGDQSGDFNQSVAAYEADE